ncbi:MAG: OmpH family outer membrane protein [Phycisphaerales bacterium]
MTLTERVAVFSGLAIAIGLGLAAQAPGSAAIADAPLPREGEFKLATVDVLSIIAKKLETPDYKQANAANADKFDVELRGMLKDLEDIRTRALAMPEGADPRKALEAEFMQKNQKFEESRAAAQQAVEAFNTTQVSEAYRLAVEAANGLAQARGYTHVIVTRGDQVKIASQSVAGAVQEILARPVIRGVSADDLTTDVVKQMGLEGIVVPVEGAANPGPVGAPGSPTTPVVAPK